MEILQNFGFEGKMFFAQVVNFLVLALLIRLFLWKPVKQVLQERRAAIAKGLDDAQQSKALFAQAEQEKARILKETRVEAQQIIDQARAVADESRQQILEASRRESALIIEQAKAQAQAELARMEKQIKVMAVDLSQKMLFSIMPALFTDSDKDKVMKRAVEKLAAVDSYEQGRS